MIPTEPNQLTPEQRDELAEWAGGERRFSSSLGRCVYVFPGAHIKDSDFWHPETSYDDCCPLFEEIERRGLWEEFFENLLGVKIPPRKSPFTMARHLVIFIALSKREHLTPADIVEAFRRTIEAVDKELAHYP